MDARPTLFGAIAKDRPMQPLLLGLALAPPVLAIWTYLDHALLKYRVAGFRALCILAGITFLTLLIRKIPLQRPRPMVLAAGLGLFLVSVASLNVAAISKIVAETYLTRNLVLLLFAWFVFSAYFQRSAEQRNALFVALLAGSTLFLLVILGVIAIHAGDPDYHWRAFWAGVTHTRHIGYFTTIHVAMAAALFSISDNRRERVVFALCLLLGFTVANMAGGRTSIVAGLIVAVSCVLIGDARRRRANTALVLALFAASVPLSMIYIPPHPLWGFQRLASTASGDAVQGGFVGSRELLWGRALERIPDHPWIGWGEGQFRSLQKGIWQANHPHNVVLQSLVSYGILGSLAIFVLVWTSLYRSLKAVWRDPHRHLVPLAIVFGLALLSVTDGPLFYLGPLQVFTLACVMARIAGLRDCAEQTITAAPER